MNRVRVDHFKMSTGGVYVPHLADDREVLLCMQPGAAEAMLAAAELETEICLAGPRGPGKSLALLADYLQEIGKWGPAWRGIIFRRSMTGFEDFRAECNKYISQIFPDATFNQNQNRWNFTTGEILLFRYFDEVLDFSSHLGANYSFVGFEELAQWETDQAIRLLRSCLRGTRPGVPRRIRATTNPDGLGHSWIKHRYQASDFYAMNDYILGPRIAADAIGPDRRMIYSRLLENQALLVATPSYLEDLKTSAVGEGRYEGWINGSWQILSGDMFGDVWLDAKTYATLPALPADVIPGSWRIDRAMDFGDSAPFSICWFAESDGSPIVYEGRRYNFIRGDLVLFMEWFGQRREPNKGLRLPAAMIRDGIIQREIDAGLRWQDHNGKWHSRVYPGPADPQIWNLKPGAGGLEPVGTIADDFEEPTTINGHRFPGIKWEPADKSPGSRIGGWQALRGRIHAAIPDKNGIRERKGIFVCENVRSFFDYVVTLPRDLKGNNREDIPQSHVNDHTAECIRGRLQHNSAPRVSFKRRWSL